MNRIHVPSEYPNTNCERWQLHLQHGPAITAGQKMSKTHYHQTRTSPVSVTGLCIRSDRTKLLDLIWSIDIATLPSQSVQSEIIERNLSWCGSLPYKFFSGKPPLRNTLGNKKAVDARPDRTKCFNRQYKAIITLKVVIHSRNTSYAVESPLKIYPSSCDW